MKIFGYQIIKIEEKQTILVIPRKILPLERADIFKLLIGGFHCHKNPRRKKNNIVERLPEVIGGIKQE
jgi:hypothetical protein